ncbi:MULTISPECIES: DUF6765 family protein [unclassified Dehalobacter]|uniref:DUF6765 family protein n=1 Tax=unclassified Dehalobacter TaxID=2635733 RepID=UPI000E6C4DA9|nr:MULTISPECIES: DUF6765 family protein [unclassified Dehalobacter]RJE48582.1 hypothetical protein A7K50_09440 [Dehalobacter sp. MCB1]TCX46717.1 hypothetical protein C1I36_14770 [Dehalobacter sp. 14DCB1]TCX51252.1 hypothetical protein C1I38_10745 [Dehalobacter sp. 12DCB1]
MKRDIHYYALLAFCRSCGFNKESSRKIAYASQYVDDAKINLMTIQNPAPEVSVDRSDNRAVFLNMATCHSYFKIKTFNYEAMINNTCAFHFVPGCKGENFTKKLRCKEESPVILALLNEALDDNNLIKLGIVLHAYADTFSHQGFSGMLSKVNDINHCGARNEVYLGIPDLILYLFKQLCGEKYDEMFDRIIPAYGHGQALTFPDLPYLVWSYQYDSSGAFEGRYTVVEIDNKERYQRALAKIKRYLEIYLKKHPEFRDPNYQFGDISKLMSQAINKASDKNREEGWIAFMLEHGMFQENEWSGIVYQESEWLRKAFQNFDPKTFNNRRVNNVILADHFAESDWHHFYQAVKWYKKRFFECCHQYGLFIPK